jgi:type I restriction enzyme S subunit
LLNNQKVYENSLDDLQLICDTYMDTLKNIENQQTLGELVELVDNRNSEDKVKKLLGINVNKVFMPSKANVTRCRGLVFQYH